MYGGDTSIITRQALHCSRMIFTSPISGKLVDAAAALPEDMQKALESARIYRQYE